MFKSKVQSPKSKVQNSSLALMLLVFGVYLLTMSGHTYSTDEETMLAASSSLVESGTWAIHPSNSWVHVEGADGRHYSIFGPGQSFAAVPWVAAGLLIGGFFPKEQAGFPLRLILASYNALIAAGTCGLLAATGMALGYRRRTSLFLGGTLAFATFFWPHSRTFFAEPLVALCLLASFYLILKTSHATDASHPRPNRLILLSGALFAAALLVKVQYAVALPAFLLFLAIRNYRIQTRDHKPFLQVEKRSEIRGDAGPVKSPTMTWLAGLGLGLIPLLIYDWAIFGSPFETGYGSDFETLFSTPLYEGAYGLLLSPGKGLLWYALPLLLALAGFSRFARRHRAEATLVLALTVTLVSFFGMFHFWWGGGSWGPRFLVPLLPFALLPALPAIQRAIPALPAKVVRVEPEGQLSTSEFKIVRAILISTVVALGFFVNLGGVLVNFDTYINAGENDDSRNWFPTSSPIAGHFNLLGQRLKVREGLLTLLKPSGTLFFKSSFSYSEGSKERQELLPRWTTGNGAIEFHPDLSKGPAMVTLRLSDHRPPEMPRAAVTLLENDKPTTVQTAPVADSPVSTDYTFPISISPAHVEIRSDTWNPTASGGERNEDIGIRLDSISVIEGGTPRRYDMVETLPAPAYYPQPRWYYDFDTKHPADLWFVYMVEAGMGRKTMLAIAAPIVLLSLLCIFLGVRGLRERIVGGT
jgi:hypothetical protein